MLSFTGVNSFKMCLRVSMDYIKLWRFSVWFTIVLHCLACSVAQVEDECSPRCWNPVRPNAHIFGGIEQQVTNEGECKALCVNSESCIGVDWNTDLNKCWFQTREATVYDRSHINHWSLAECKDGWAAHCWKPVKCNHHVSGGGIIQSNISDENHCKLLCSNTLNCSGIDWDSRCYLLYSADPLKIDRRVRHWDIERNASTSNQGSKSSTVGITPNTATPLQCPTESFEDLHGSANTVKEGIIECSESDYLISGIIVLAVSLGIGIFVIIGLILNTIRISRKLQQQIDMKTTELEANYECLQMAYTM